MIEVWSEEYDRLLWEDKMIFEIPYKFPSLNDYTGSCGGGWAGGAAMKRKIQKDIKPYIDKMPVFKKPIKIGFTWIEANNRRDYDNICFAKKFILDAMQECGKLKNDNRKWVRGFLGEEFEVGKEYKVILRIEEVDD